MKNKFGMRLVAMLLSIVMMAGILPINVFAAWEDGMECWFCNHYHWDAK